MALRIFECSSCGHRMRFFGGVCGFCRSRRSALARGGPILAMLGGYLIFLLLLVRAI